MSLMPERTIAGDMPWTVQAHVALALAAVVTGVWLDHDGLDLHEAAFALFYISVTAGYVRLRANWAGFAMAGFHLVTLGLGIMAFWLVPPELAADQWVIARGALVIFVSLAILLLQCTPPTRYWVDRR